MNMTSVEYLRSWLFVPGNDAHKIEHAFSSLADVVILDWEDAVLAQDKEKARDCTKKACTTLPKNKLTLVRTNSHDNENFGEDLKQLASIRPGGIMLPKCESAHDLQEIAAYLDEAASGWQFELVPLIESPLGLLRAEEIATASDRVSALAFGAHDFAAATGIRPSRDELELHMARSGIVTVAKAYGLAAIDSPVSALKDTGVIRESSERAYRMGFTGKLAIHPAQIAVIHETFTPSDEEVRDAQEVLQQAESLRAGAFSWKGRMVDKAILENARTIVNRFQHSRSRQ
jgi:citrate lyase subunit beta/citryl-CoA lyase